MASHFGHQFAMSETASAALLMNPRDPESIAGTIEETWGAKGQRLRTQESFGAGEFTRVAAKAERIPMVYREVHSRRLARTDC